MNLIQSICCFVSRRCGSKAAPKKADQDGYVETRDAGTAPHRVARQLLKRRG